MSVSVEAGSVDGALCTLASYLSDGYHTRRVVRRGMAVRELTGLTTVQVNEPRRRLCLNPARLLNPWVSLAEFPWLVAGRSDVGWLLPYLPRAQDYSDDGIHWRAGYGPRLRNWGAQHFGAGVFVTDQLRKLVSLLKDDPMTRQAVVSIWDPAADLNVVSKDIPCTNWMHFQAHENEGVRTLDLTVVMRSNDVLWGFSGVNAVNFTLLLELVASLTGMNMGTYRHVSTNMHVYETHAQRLHNIAQYDPPPGVVVVGDGVKPANNLKGFTAECQRVLSMLEQRRTSGAPVTAVGTHEPWLYHWSYFMDLHRAIGVEGPEWWRKALASVEDPTWRLAAAAYLTRRWPAYRPSLEDALQAAGLAYNGSSYMAAVMEVANG